MIININSEWENKLKIILEKEIGELSKSSQ